MLEPFIWTQLLFFLMYYASSMYFLIRRPELIENISFDYRAPERALILATFGSLGLSLGYFSALLALGKKDASLSFIRRNFLYSELINNYVIIASVALSLVRVYGLINGYGGSMQSFSDNFSPIYSIAGIFWVYIFFYIAYGFISRGKYPIYFYIILIFELLYSFIVGNRRDILPIIISILISIYIKNGCIRVGFVKLFLSLFGVIFITMIATIYGYALANNQNSILDYMS